MAEQAGRSTIARAAVAKDTPARPYEVRADKPVGLLLRVQPSGARTFYVQVSRAKRIKIGPAGTWTLERARRRATEILLDPDAALEAAARRRSTGETLLDYIEAHYTEHALAKLKNGAKSIARVKAVWAPLLSKRIDSITAGDIDKIRNRRVLDGAAPATVNRDVAALSGVFSHWVANTKDAVHPLAGLESLDVADDERVRYLAPDELQRLRKALADRDRRLAEARASANRWRVERGYDPMPEIKGYADHMTPMVLVSLNTGLRQGELFSLTWAQIDFQHKTLAVLASNSKGNATRVVPLNAEALQVLTTIKPEKAAGLVFKSPVTGERFNNVKKAWAEITKAAGVPDVRWHDLRHHFASTLVTRGVSLFAVQKLLGHSTPKMTMRYAKLAPNVLADAVAMLEG
jgi:integrase